MNKNEKDNQIVEVSVDTEVLTTEVKAEDVIEEKVEEIVLPALEQEKNKFTKRYNGSRLTSLLSTIVVVAIVVVAYTVIFPLEPNGAWLAIIIIILALVGSMVFSRLLRRKVTDFVKTYMSDYNEELNTFSLAKSDIQNYSYDFKGEINSEVFTEAKLLKDIINATSRNLMKYETKGINVQIADFVAYRQADKQAKAVFVGKLLTAERKAKVDGRIIIHLKPNPTIFSGETGGPDDTDDLDIIEETPQYRLYSSTTEVGKKLNNKALAKLLEIKPSKDLADVTVSIYDNKVVVALTLSDALMVVPYKEVVPGLAITEYQSNLTLLNEFLALL